MAKIEEIIILNKNYISKTEDGEQLILIEYDFECYKGSFKKEMYSRQEVEIILQHILKVSKPLKPIVEDALFESYLYDSQMIIENRNFKEFEAEYLSKDF